MQTERHCKRSTTVPTSTTRQNEGTSAELRCRLGACACGPLTWHHRTAAQLTRRRATHACDPSSSPASRWNSLRTPSHLETSRHAESRIRIGSSKSMRTESNYPTGSMATEWSWRQILGAATSPRAYFPSGLSPPGSRVRMACSRRLPRYLALGVCFELNKSI